MVKRHTPGIIAIIAGMIAIITDINGSTRLFKIIFDVVAQFVPSPMVTVFGWVLFVLQLLAGLGGITVILGGLGFFANRLTLGRFFIGIGIGLGLIGLLFSILIAVFGGSPITTIYRFLLGLATLRGLSIILSIVARQTSKRVNGKPVSEE